MCISSFEESGADEEMKGRRAKRKVVYVDPDSDDDSEDEVKPTTSNGRRPRKSLKEDSEDEYMFDEADDAAMGKYKSHVVRLQLMKVAAALDDFEANNFSPSKSPSPPRKITKAKAKPSVPSKKPMSTPVRPGPKPIANKGSESNSFLTAAERKKIQAKEDKRESEQCFDFLVNIRDKEGNRPDDPDYDRRSILIPKKSWAEFTPFEKQFWEIKQNHYDTVLFFQKGKFYELYEDDALIGHQEFDLKLTDRVKMKMVSLYLDSPRLVKRS